MKSTPLSPLINDLTVFAEKFILLLMIATLLKWKPYHEIFPSVLEYVRRWKSE